MKKPARMQKAQDYIWRHRRTIINRLTFRKLLNAAVNQFEYRAKKTVLRSKPLFMKVEPTYLCQIHCPACTYHQVGSKVVIPKNPNLGYDDFVKIVEPIKDYLVGISLSARGEPTLCKDLFKMIRYCSDNNIGTDIASNLSKPFSDEDIEASVDSGLDHVLVALDGTTQEVYEMYRIGGRLDLVLENSRRIIEAKRRKGADHPFMEAKFIFFQHNKHQYEEAKQLSIKMGFDRFSSVLDWNDPERLSENKAAIVENRAKKRVCYWPYRTLLVGWDGAVFPCCSCDFTLGNAIADNIRDVWNNVEYRELRKAVSSGKVTSENSKHCVGCVMFQR